MSIYFYKLLCQKKKIFFKAMLSILVLYGTIFSPNDFHIYIVCFIYINYGYKTLMPWVLK